MKKRSGFPDAVENASNRTRGFDLPHLTPHVHFRGLLSSLLPVHTRRVSSKLVLIIHEFLLCYAAVVSTATSTGACLALGVGMRLHGRQEGSTPAQASCLHREKHHTQLLESHVVILATCVGPSEQAFGARLVRIISYCNVFVSYRYAIARSPRREYANTNFSPVL